MVTYTCPTCLKIREVSMLEGRGSYLIGNKRYLVLDDKGDCGSCLEKLREDDDKKRIQIRHDTLEL